MDLLGAVWQTWKGGSMRTCTTRGGTWRGPRRRGTAVVEFTVTIPLLALASGIFVFFIAVLIRRPVNTLTQKTAAIAQGDLTQEIPVELVARQDEKWGETPCAFVTLKPGVSATEAEIVAFCRAHMAHFKAPKRVVFGPLPKTSTGKIQKFELRKRSGAVAAIDV